MLTEVFNIDRGLRIAHKKLLNSNITDINMFSIVDDYLTDYAKFHNLSIGDISLRQNNFMLNYLKNVKDYLLKGKYPHLLGIVNSIERVDYDISLIISTVVAIHRYRIMDNFIKYVLRIKGDVLIIGLGSGLELELLNNVNNQINNVDAYDIIITEFVRNRFKNTFNIIENEFKGNGRVYDYIIAIELLEHLENPYPFLSMCFNSLKKKGTMITTTATNVPQFDHLFNFDDDNAFNQEIRSIGYHVSLKEDIQHNYMTENIKAKNTWYILKK
jgi:2-polyprenyl-3-methyl-5-hydroxy-6-metoxy-1,4-benzoquinol methylase